MNNGLYRRDGAVATDCAAACANWLQDPTTKLSNVYLGFNCVRGELKRSSFATLSKPLPFCAGSSYTTTDSPIPIPRRIEFTRFEYSLSIQARVSSLGTATRS